MHILQRCRKWAMASGYKDMRTFMTFSRDLWESLALHLFCRVEKFCQSTLTPMPGLLLCLSTCCGTAEYESTTGSWRWFWHSAHSCGVAQLCRSARWSRHLRIGWGPSNLWKTGFGSRVPLLRERVPDRNACLCQRSCLKPTAEGQACRKSLCNVQTWSMLQATCGCILWWEIELNDARGFSG